MPSFSKEVNVDEYVDVDLDISVSEFFDELDDDEKKEMYELLIEDGIGYGGDINQPSGRASWEFDDAIVKLKKNYYALTNEEIELLVKMSKRF